MKLRVGILLDCEEQAAWVCRMFEIVKISEYAEIVLVVKHAPRESSDDHRIHSPFHKILCKIQRRLVGKPGYIDNALARFSITDLIAGIPTIGIIIRQNKDGDHIDDAGIQKIRESDIDVLIQIPSAAFDRESLAVARYGIWSLEIGNHTADCCVQPGYWEVIESRPTIRSLLRIRTIHCKQGGIAAQSYSSTNDRSIEDNASNVLWKSLYFVPRKLRELHREGGKEFLAMLQDDEPNSELHVLEGSKYSSDWHFGKLLCLKLWQKLYRKWRDMFYFRQWFLQYDFEEYQLTSFKQYRRLTPPKDRSWADPFVIHRDGKYYVFFEECLLSQGKGFISVLALNKDGVIDEPVPVLRTEYHLSYPFLLEHEGELYIIPETSDNRTVELYMCTEFPLKWEFQKNLMTDCSIVDATILNWGGRWWMFANSVCDVNASIWDELHVFHSDSPLSDKWVPHTRNPVVSDVRSSRPAGRIFVRNGRIYRPSQNSSRHYGYGFNICEITELSESEYSEQIVSRIEPGWDNDVISTHTINHAYGLTLMDGQIWRRK